MNILCFGDIAISGNITSTWLPPDGITPSNETKILFNWELPIGITRNPIPRTSGPRLLSCPDSVDVVRKWAPGFAALATNHILDAGEEELATTINTLQQAGFETVGAGLSIDQIKKPLIWETDEGRLGVINWVFPETNPDWMHTPGPNCWPGHAEAKHIIKNLKCEVDWLLVIVHWSDEYFPYPRSEDRRIARDLALMGVDIVVGHHPHVVRGMEIIESCPVYYSIGNFYFSNMDAPRNRESIGIQISFQRGKKPVCNILSFWQTKERTALDPLHRAARKMRQMSKPLQQFQGSDYSKWYDIKRARFSKWGYRWHFSLWNNRTNDWKRVTKKYLNRIIRPRLA